MLKFTHSYCACDIAWFLPVVHSGTPQQNGSNIPGNSTKEEADKEQKPAKTDAATREAVMSMSTHTCFVILIGTSGGAVVGWRRDGLGGSRGAAGAGAGSWAGPGSCRSPMLCPPPGPGRRSSPSLRSLLGLRAEQHTGLGGLDWLEQLSLTGR
jgi:hypothetical protein